MPEQAYIAILDRFVERSKKKIFARATLPNGKGSSDSSFVII
jgi:hypothetical protein